MRARISTAGRSARPQHEVPAGGVEREPSSRLECDRLGHQALRPTGPRQASRRQRDAAERGGGSQAPADATRNRVLALVSRFFNLFETWEWRPQHTNPVRGVERAGEDALA